MKKTYITPWMETIEYKPVQLLSGSGVESMVLDDNIDYGGIDIAGDLDAEAEEFVLGLRE